MYLFLVYVWYRVDRSSQKGFLPPAKKKKKVEFSSCHFDCGLRGDFSAEKGSVTHSPWNIKVCPLVDLLPFSKEIPPGKNFGHCAQGSSPILS